MRDELTDDELRFLARHGYSPEDVLDARPYSQWMWKRLAKEQGKDIVLGTPCGKGGHRLRTRAGHCAQCDPKKLAFVQRHSADQYVYIAESSSTGLIKIGTCGDIFQRENQLRAERYGGIWDWNIVFRKRTKNAGLVESIAHRSLKRHAVYRPYVKDGIAQTAIELLNCPTTVAEETLTRALGTQS